MLITLFSILACIFLLLVVLLAFSPGKISPVLDESGKPPAGSISEKTHIIINGVELGMFIRSRDSANPVLLYLHGGMPEYFLSRKYPTSLEDHFTVVWWDQRGSGISCRSDIKPETMTLAQMISDTKEVTNYLRNRFSKDKIYLLGHSGGSFIGIHVAAESPELYHAYIGMAQMADQLKSEMLAWEYMLEQYLKAGNKKMVRKLESAEVTMGNGTPEKYRALRDPAMHSLGIGTTRKMTSVVSGIFLPSLMNREYTLREKIDMWRGKSRSGISILWADMLSTDMSDRVPELTIPVYFFEGIYDYTCSYTVAKSYFDKLKAPVKGFYSFGKSAHSPIFEEPDRFVEIMISDIINVTTTLAD